MPKLRNKKDICLYIKKEYSFLFESYGPTVKRTLRNRRSMKREWSLFRTLRYKCKMLSFPY